MIIDTSAVLAILLGESDAQHYESAIAHTFPRRMSAAGLLEAAIVLESRGGSAAFTPIADMNSAWISSFQSSVNNDGFILKRQAQIT